MQATDITVILGQNQSPTYGPNRPWFALKACYCYDDFSLLDQDITSVNPNQSHIIFNGLTALMTPENLTLIEQLAKAERTHGIYLHDIDWCYQAYCRYHPAEAHRLKLLDKRHTHFLAVSKHQQAFIQQTFKVPEEHIHVVGVSSLITPSTETSSETKRSGLAFGTVATIQPRKGTDFFVDAAISVCRSRPESTFHWFGVPFLDPSYHVELLRKIKTTGLSERIIFHGHIDDTSICYDALDVVLLPSRDDPFALCVLEAMSFGKLCVGFESGGFPEQVANTGIIIPEMSANALAQACLNIIDNPSLLEKGKNAKTRYDTFHHPFVFVPRLIQVVSQIFNLPITKCYEH